MSETQQTPRSTELLANHVEQTVLPKWVPYWRDNEVEAFSVNATDEGTPMVSIGPVAEKWVAEYLYDDLIRALPSGRYFAPGPNHDDTEGTYYPYVKPQTPPSDEEIERGLCWPRGVVIEALQSTPYSPKVVCEVPAWSEDIVSVRYFETECVAKHLRKALQHSINTHSHYDPKVSVEELTEKRDWLAPDTWYSVNVAFDEY